MYTKKEDNRDNHHLYLFQKELFESAKRIGRMVELIREFDDPLVRKALLEKIHDNVTHVNQLTENHLDILESFYDITRR